MGIRSDIGLAVAILPARDYKIQQLIITIHLTDTIIGIILLTTFL